jgi:tungstate transport system ATP-binding protein
MADDEPLYRLCDVRRRFGDAVALDIPALDLPRGGIHGFVGPNGAGKTLLLGLLGFLETPDAGEIFFCGRRVFPRGRGAPVPAFRVTLVSQSPFLFDTTVLGNVLYGLRRAGRTGSEAAGMARESLRQVGLSDLESRQAGTLSGGEGKRLALARALVLRPDVLLLDEPMANVDAANARILESVLKGLCEQPGTTIVVTSHDLALPDRLGACARTLYRGRLLDVPPENLFAGRVEVRGAGRVIRLADGVEVAVDADRTGPVCIAVDARAVSLSVDDRDPAAPNRFDGVVTAVSCRGGLLRVEVDVGVPIVAWVEPRGPRGMAPVPGARRTVAFRASDVRVV